MRDIMTPIPFSNLMTWILEEQKKYGTCFGTHKIYKADTKKTYSIFGHKLETLLGPAAGPHTQLAQNIIASYVSGARFIELKTVQKLDGLDLPVAKPCIKADDECYNCEWSTELFIPQAYDEYIKAYFAIKVLAKEWGLGDMDGFMYSMSCGYDLQGIKTKKIDTFIENMKNAEKAPQFIECKEWLEKNIKLFKKFKKADINKISPKICNQVTVSTLHGCPPQEIEAIASYLIKEKHLHTLVKCNPTLLGYDYARKILDDMGYTYIKFGDFHFKDDLQYKDAVPMLQRLKKLAEGNKLLFGVKITNTFPVDVKEKELPSEEMYMSGKSLFPLSMSVAKKLADDFKGELRISYSGGCDAHNVEKILNAGIFPVTVATTLLKPGGYNRFIQLNDLAKKSKVKMSSKVDNKSIEKIIAELKVDPNFTKNERADINRTIGKDRHVPFTDCFVAPCMESCPIHQDITTYGDLVAKGKYVEALKVIFDKNPLPFITGTICNHKCMQSCTRNHYETPIQIRHNKLLAALNGYDKFIKTLKPAKANGKKVVIVGAGPAGIASATFLAKNGFKVKVFDRDAKIGGIVRNVIPDFRISGDVIEKDASFARALGVEFVMNYNVTDVKDLMKKEKANYAILCIGAYKDQGFKLKEGESLNAHKFLREFNDKNGNVQLGENVIVVGSGNTAMDSARAAKKVKGVKNVYIMYRRTKQYMPADDAELNEAISEGIIFKELILPISVKNKMATCRIMKLTDMDDSGRRSVVETDKLENYNCDTLIDAIGEKVEGEFYTKQGIKVDAKGLPVVNCNNETSLKNVFACGDGKQGVSVVVKAIADCQVVAEYLTGKTLFKDIDSVDKEKEHIDRKIKITDCEGVEGSKKPDKDRCLKCDYICENCVDVCPNRANVAIEVESTNKKLFKSFHQIIHIDYMCNECGNCKSFCPYNSAPYKDKFTLYLNKQDLYSSTNSGFCMTDKATALVKINEDLELYKIGDKKSKLDKKICALIDAVVKKYPYLFLK